MNIILLSGNISFTMFVLVYSVVLMCDRVMSEVSVWVRRWHLMFLWVGGEWIEGG